MSDRSDSTLENVVYPASASGTISWVLDPMAQFGEESNEWLIACCGLIPSFLDPFDPRPSKEQFETNYGFGALYEMQGGTVTEDGAYTYPGDPDLFPIAQAHFVNADVDEIIRIYHYGIVSIKDTKSGDAFVTRMD